MSTLIAAIYLPRSTQSLRQPSSCRHPERQPSSCRHPERQPSSCRHPERQLSSCRHPERSEGSRRSISATAVRRFPPQPQSPSLTVANPSRQALTLPIDDRPMNSLLRLLDMWPDRPVQHGGKRMPRRRHSDWHGQGRHGKGERGSPHGGAVNPVQRDEIVDDHQQHQNA